jgi:environmental stress-induced protein Ves
VSAGLVRAGFEATGSASDLFGIVRIVNILSDVGTILQMAGHGALNAKAKATKQFHANVFF